jgi:hypothetical protein
MSMPKLKEYEQIKQSIDAFIHTINSASIDQKDKNEVIRSMKYLSNLIDKYHLTDNKKMKSVISLCDLLVEFKKLQSSKTLNSPDDKNALYKHVETLCKLLNEQDQLKHPYLFNIESVKLTFKDRILFFGATISRQKISGLITPLESLKGYLAGPNIPSIEKESAETYTIALK